MPGPHGGPNKAGVKAKDFKGSMGKLIKYIGRYKFSLLLVMIFAVGSTIFNVIGPKILGNATTELYTGLIAKLQGTGSIDFDKIASILIMLLGIYLLAGFMQFIQSWIMTNISQKMSYRMRKDITEKINRVPLSYFESNQIGDVLSRITNDVDTLGQSFNQSITTFITSLCTIVGVIWMMLTISPLMTLICLAIIPVTLILTLIIVGFSQKHFRAQQKYLGKINAQIEETFSGQTVVKAYNREEAEIKKFDETNKTLFNSAWKSQFLSGLMMPIMNFISNIGYVLVAVIGAGLASNGTIAIGDIVAFIQYVKSFTQPITQLAQVSNMFQQTAAAAERIFEFLEIPEEVPDVESPADAEAITGAVKFDHVKFGYDPEKVIIKDFSCDVEEGETIAIVGPTGAGKTTLVKLLMRFYDVNDGSIKLDGNDIRTFKRNDLRSSFGMVLQDTWLFHGTIMENIRYGKLDATDEEVIAAAKTAHAHRFIKTLPGGYNMVINEEGTNISQGQKQLITIARAVLANNKVLILDEATSSVDTRTEHSIQKGMDKLMEGRTSFVIAHRLSTIKNADKILVLNDGDIVEQGTHDELMDLNGFYADLYTSQFDVIAG